jgi:DNA-binding transcriptional LysR family regulator
VAEELHFGRAAKRLNISQPPLSQQIMALEEEIGVQLLERSTSHVVLTQAGKSFLEGARQTLERAAHAVDLARRADAGAIGEVGIGFTNTVPLDAIFQQTVSRFTAARPLVHLTFVEDSERVLLEMMAQAKIDVAVIRTGATRPGADGLTATELFTDALVALLPANHPLATVSDSISVEDIATEKLIVRHRERAPGVFGVLESLYARHGLKPAVAFEAVQLSTVFGLVAANLGIGILPRSVTALRCDGVVFRPFKDPDALATTWMVHPSTHRSTAAESFATVLQGHAVESAKRKPRTDTNR